MTTQPQPESERFLAMIDALAPGYRTGSVDGRRYGISLKRSADGRRTTLYAEALDGSDIISFNLYMTRGAGPVLKPCEMSSDKVVRFMLECVPDECAVSLQGQFIYESPRQAMMAPIDLKAKLQQFDAHWSPKRVAGFNGHDIMVVKALGDFNWHVHEETDDFFLVLSGTFTVHFRDRDVQVGAGELFIVPAGVEHRTSATGEAHLLLIEPAGTPNTGDPATAAVVEVI